MATRARHSPEKIKQIVAAIRTFYRRGKSNLRTRPGRAKHGDNELGKDALRFGVSPHVLTRARQFADPERGYTEDELDEMFVSFAKFGFALGRSTVFLLASVRPKSVRAKLQQRAIKHGWTESRLHLEVIKEFGPRRVGGRWRNVPTDKTDLLVQLESECERWRRWRAAIDRAGKDGKTPGQSLPEDLYRRIAQVSKSIEVLRRQVEEELANEKPGRKARMDLSSARSVKP
jgi:hypothetical protein